MSAPIGGVSSAAQLAQLAARQQVSGARDSDGDDDGSRAAQVSAPPPAPVTGSVGSIVNTTA